MTMVTLSLLLMFLSAYNINWILIAAQIKKFYNEQS